MIKLSEALLVGMASALIATALLRAANFSGAESVLKSQPAFDRVTSTHTLRCTFSSVAPYFSTIDASRDMKSGVAYDIAQEMGHILHLEIVWADDVAGSDAADKLQRGDDDAICFPVWPTAQNAASLDFTTAFDYMPFYAYVRPDDARFDGNLSKINDSNVTVPVIDGGPVQLIADEDYPEAPQLSLKEEADALHLLLAVSSKQADVAISDAFNGEDFIRNNPGTLRQVANVGPVRVFAETFAVNKGETKLRDMINVALQQMIQSGFIRQTLDRHLAEHKGLYFYPTSPWESPKADKP